MRKLLITAALFVLAAMLVAQDKPASAVPGQSGLPPKLADKDVDASSVQTLFGTPDRPIATIETTDGVFRCALFADEAPQAVDNFIGLSTGMKDWIDPESGATRHHIPLYPGTVFHRIVPGFMIQGGDPLGTGDGDPGIKFDDEFSDLLSFDRPGRLAMANSGPATNGTQFFITEVPLPTLNRHHTIFGQCDNVELVQQIARMARDPHNDRPVNPVSILRITIEGVRMKPPAPNNAAEAPNRPPTPPKSQP